ncbi:MAG TPA: ATP-binding cassette domain-containing protein, partial [Acidimicrobiales bacterium]|nr:ATP-binding cassette domain-containing protein [Acidimicrobiales bacterium]
AENHFLGWSGAPTVARRGGLEARAAEAIAGYGFRLDPRARLRELSMGERQRVAILRVLIRGASVLILDEPTATLTPQESDGLFEVMRTLAGEGKTVIFITHKLREVLEVSDRVSVLRAGSLIATLDAAQCDERSLASEMLGRDVSLPVKNATSGPATRQSVLRVSGLSVRSDAGLLAVDGVSFEIGEHEIVGVAGVAGNGQRELSEALAGVRRPAAGTIILAGTDLAGKDSAAFVRAGVGYIPEDRLGTGMMARESVARNAVMKALHVELDRKMLTRGPWLRLGQIDKFARVLLAEGQVSTRDPKTIVGNLSGGNVQRLLIARELRAATRLLVAVHPTRGLDVGATERAWRLLLAARDEGRAVLLISEDLDEILSVSDRVLVMYGGRVAGEVDNSGEVPPSRQHLGLLMGGLAVTVAPGGERR